MLEEQDLDHLAVSLEGMAKAFNPDAKAFLLSEEETILNNKGERDGKTYRAYTFIVYEQVTK